MKNQLGDRIDAFVALVENIYTADPAAHVFNSYSTGNTHYLCYAISENPYGELAPTW